MREARYQSNIIKGIESRGGRCVNGTFSKSGETDLQCGWPVCLKPYEKVVTVLFDLCVEVKTEIDYHRVMSGITEVDGLYEITDHKKLKKHEPLQIYKINKARKLGGMAVIAYNIDQVAAYVDLYIEKMLGEFK